MTELAPAEVVRPPWQCATCGHHRLTHWWNTAADPDGTAPGTVFGACLDSDPECRCGRFTVVEASTRAAR